mmetsp:Transcript_11691/g.50002  ORF Transcript_11691/g.50002 Transcript_11691/m.50002 type:complete len:236 (+) Transcript_11691:798-1505(+)
MLCWMKKKGTLARLSLARGYVRFASRLATSALQSSSSPRERKKRGRFFSHCFSAQTRAFWNMRNHGPGPSADKPESAGNQGICHPKNARSGCGIIARCRPSFEHKPATPIGEPLGFRGYASVASPLESTYLMGAHPLSTTGAIREASGNFTLPSPCAIQTPSFEPCMPWSITAGVFSSMPTVTQRLSNLPESLWMKRGCSASGSDSRPSSAGTKPSSAISWHPLHTPSEKVSGRS